MKKTLVILLLLVLLCTFAACDLNKPSGGNQGGDELNMPDDYEYQFGDDVTVNNDNFYKDYSQEEKALYYELWKETTTVTIKVDIEPSELVKINEALSDYENHNSAKADTYRRCNLTITVNGVDYYYEEVGIRKNFYRKTRYPSRDAYTMVLQLIDKAE